MKKIAIVAVLAALIAGAAPTQALAKKTLRQRVTALEKVNAKQSRQITNLTTLVRLADSRAQDAQSNLAFLFTCLLVQTAGPVDVLDASTTASFAQGDATLGIADVFQWLPVNRAVIQADGPDYLAMFDPSCIATPTPAPSARRGWAPRHFTLSFR